MKLFGQPLSLIVKNFNPSSFESLGRISSSVAFSFLSMDISSCNPLPRPVESFLLLLLRGIISGFVMLVLTSGVEMNILLDFG